MQQFTVSITTIYHIHGSLRTDTTLLEYNYSIHSLLLATMQTGRSLECSQIRNCSSGKLSKAFHTSIATVTAVRRELCFRKGKKNQNHNDNIMNVNKPGSDGRPRSPLLRALQDDFADFSVVCYVGLVIAIISMVWSTHGLGSAFFHVGRQFGASRPNTH